MNACRSALLLAAMGLVWSGARAEQGKEDDKLTVLHAAKTVRIEVEQSYNLRGDEEETTEPDASAGEAKAETPTSHAEPQVTLPLAEEAAKLLAAFGLRVVSSGPADLELKITAEGRPLSGQYSNFGIGEGNRQYAGAELEGRIALWHEGAEVAGERFSFTYELPGKLTFTTFSASFAGGFGPHNHPADAPFHRALPGFYGALLKLGHRLAGAPALLAALQLEDATVRACAAIELGTARETAALAALRGCLADPTPATQAAAAWALGELKDPAAIASLLAAPATGGRWRGDGPDGEADASGADFSTEAGSVWDIFQYRFGEAPDVYLFFREALRRIAMEQSDMVTGLTAALRDTNLSADRRADVALVLGELQAESVRPALETALHDGAFQVRASAAVALAQLKDIRSAPVLMAATLDADKLVRYQAEEAMAMIDGSRWRELMMQAGYEPEIAGGFSRSRLYAVVVGQDPVLRWRAFGELPAPTTPEECSAWAAGLQDKFPLIRRAALEGAQKLQDIGPVREALRLALRDAEPAIRRNTATLLARDAKTDELEWLLPLRHDPDAEVQQALMEALAKFSDPRALAVLSAALLDDGSPLVQDAAGEALGSYPDQTATVVLLGMLEGQDRSYSSAVVTALGKRKDPRAIGSLVALLEKETKAAETAKKDAAARTTGTPDDSAAEEDTGEQGLAGAIHNALREITGKEFPRPEDWRAWLAQQPAKPANEAPKSDAH